MKSQPARRRRGLGLIFATALMTITFSADSQQTTAPVKSEPARPESATQAPAAHPPSPTKKPAPPSEIKKIDINNATLAELRALPLGEAEAKKVIAHRPYKAKGELMTKAGLAEGVYFTIKDKLELQVPRKPAPKK